MNTPKLDALLKEVDALDAKMRCGRIADAIGAAEEVVGYTPTLAAMLRVAVGALDGVSVDLDPHYPPLERTARKRAYAALARIEQIAAESCSDDPEAAEEEAS